MKLNIGAGDSRLDGFFDIDRKTGAEAYPLEYKADTIDEIRASHILEHLSYAEATKALAEWFRILKPGAVIRIAVPDAIMAAAMADKDPAWRFYLAGGQTDKNDFHRSVWSRACLTQALSEAGFGEIKAWEGDKRDTSSHAVSLNLEAVKLLPKVKIAAVMSLPRVGWNDNWGCAVDALQPFGIPIWRFTGAFWGQCLQNALEKAMAAGIDWILTIDYDTLFNRNHIDQMFAIFGENPHIDALAPIQPKRTENCPLMTCMGEKQVEVTGEPILVTTAHFGLTLIRLDSLKDVKKPWFCGKPDKDGGWQGDDRLDPDIWFWHQWRLAGKKIYVAPDVSVGHIELMAAWMDPEDFQTKHMHIKTWRERFGDAGKTGEA